MDIPSFRYLANSHEYWVERLPSFTDFRAAEVPIHFACRIISHYLICFPQLPHFIISTPAMPTQTCPWRAPPAGTAAAKKRSTQATPTSARDVAAAGATCWDCNDSEQRRRQQPATAGAGRGRRHRSQPPAQAAAAGTGHGQRSLSSLLFAVVAVPALAVVAVPAGGARRGHVPRARRRRCCGPLLRRGRPRRWRPPRPRLRGHCRRRNSTAGNLPKAYQIMRNDATWKMNRYLCSVKIHVTMGVSRSQILLQIRNIAKPSNVHEKFIGAISSGEFAVKYSQVIKTPCAIEAKIHATENLKDTNQRVGVTFYHVL